MYISKIKLHNFKGYKGDHEIDFEKGVNLFVGDNNCGKSTVFEAIDFIRSKKLREEVITKTEINGSGFVSVEIEFKGDDIEDLLVKVGLKKYQSYVIDNDGQKSIRVMRSSKEDEVIQNNRSRCLSIADVRFFNPTTRDFKNPTGVDTTISALFDAQFVWADTDSNDVSDFSKTKICGKIINAITKDFTKSPAWREFRESHAKAFGDGEESICRILRPVEEKLKTILSEQYGETEVRFSFSLPEIESFFKTGNIELSESGIETKSAEKGTGMQRSLALALIQVYAEITSINAETVSKPIMFFIDEPETFLHPKAQNKLINALEKISNKSQVFIITHSPYLLRKYKKGTHSINIFSKNNGLNKVAPSQELNLFGDSSPTWGEINYYAFGVGSVEFHNELYGFIQAKATLLNENYYEEKNFDDWLVAETQNVSHKLGKDIKYIRLLKDGNTIEYNTTLPTYIRNIIHHPENTHNKKFNEEDLESSTNSLIQLLIWLNK